MEPRTEQLQAALRAGNQTEAGRSGKGLLAKLQDSLKRFHSLGVRQPFNQNERLPTVPDTQAPAR